MRGKGKRLRIGTDVPVRVSTQITHRKTNKYKNVLPETTRHT